MRPRPLPARILGLIALSSALVAPLMARASGLSTPALGAGWASMTTATPASLHFNPALLADLPGARLQLDLSGIYARARYTRQRRAAYQYADGFEFALPIDPASIDPTKTGWSDPVSADALLPAAALFGSLALGDRWAVGLGVQPTHGAPLRFPDEGPQRWQLQEVFLLGAHITPAVAFKPTSWLRIGAGLDVVLGTLSLRQVIDLSTLSFLADAFENPPIEQPNDFGPDAPAALRELDVLSRPSMIDSATATGLSFKLGLTLAPNDDVRVALAWQHGVDLVFAGDVYLDMDHDFFTGDLASQGLLYPKQVRGEAFVRLPLPAALRLGLSVRALPELTVHAQASWVLYSVVQALEVTMRSDDLAQPQLGVGNVSSFALQRRWNDTLEAELLVQWRAGQWTTLGLRAGYHSPVSPDRTVDLASIDGHRLIGSLLVKLQLLDALALSGGLGVQHVLDRTVVASDHDRGNGIYALTLLSAGATLDLLW